MDGETFYHAEKQSTDIHRLAEGQPSAKSHSLPGHGHPDTVLVVLVHWATGRSLRFSGDEPEWLALFEACQVLRLRDPQSAVKSMKYGN
jgi:hypothetical protein